MRVPDTTANRAFFGSTGTANDASPYPQVRIVVITAAVSRALLAVAFDTCHTGEQRLVEWILTNLPGVFTAGRLFLFDRNHLGADLVKQILGTGGHMLMRVGASVGLPNHGWLPDRSSLTSLDGQPMRVVEYDIAPPPGAERSGELFALVTDLLDHVAYPATPLAGAYPWRWSGAETAIGENKSTINGAGPSRGPILHSTTPTRAFQEIHAWLAATNLLPAASRHALATGAHDLPARRISFTHAGRELVRSISHSVVTATTGPALTAAALGQAAAALTSRPVQTDRHRYSPRQRWP